MWRKKWFVVPCAMIAGVGLLWALSQAGEAAGALGRRALADRPIGRLVGETVGRLLILRSQLNVTDEQREAVQAIVKENRQEIVPTVKSLVEKHRALREAVISDQPNEEAIRKAAEDLGKAIGDGAVLAAGIRAKVRGVLTREQTEKIDEFRSATDKAVDKWLEEMPKAMAED